ncbi:MAG: TIGR00730 family Rossman fold protein [Microthrixaceae bacterium]
MSRRPRYRTGVAELDESIDSLVQQADLDDNHDLYTEIITSALRMGRERAKRGDVKIVNSALKELRNAFGVFAPYADVPKCAVFGSARTGEDTEAYRMAREVGRQLAEADWMVMTGGGPGIMTAVVEGAGPEASFGVSIVLPFEPSTPQHAALFDGKNLNFRYFFSRKLTLTKESSGYIVFPGGFGTLDETMELLTLMQTGKAPPSPVVLFEPPGDAYWRSWRHYVEVELLDGGLISPVDLDVVHLTSDPTDAVDYVSDFYRVFHSIRHVGNKLYIRLNTDISDEALDSLNAEFGDVLTSGSIERAEAAAVEVEDGDVPDLPRLRLRFNNAAHGRLHLLVQQLGRLA